MLKVGIIGAGYAAQVHMQVYSLLKDRVQAAAVCDKNYEQAASFAAKFRIKSVYENHLDMLEKDMPDFVDICAPTSAHAQIAIDTAEKGSNVLVEKPMALNEEECRAMATESEKNGVSLCVCHDKIFAAPFLEAKRTMANQNDRVNLCSITSRVPEENLQHWARAAEEGGVLWEAGTHAVYAQRFFLGGIDQVSAIAKRALFPVDDTFLVLLHGKSGALGLIELSCWKTKADWFLCNIDTTRGVRFQIDPRFDYFAMTRPQQFGMTGVNWFAHVFGDVRRFSQLRIGYAIKHVSSGRTRFIRRRHLTLISRFIDSLNNHSPPPVTAEDGIETIRTLEAIQESVLKGRSVGL